MSTTLKSGNTWSDDIVFDAIIASRTASKRGIDNTIIGEYYFNARFLFDNVITPLLEKYKELEISSWYRCPELNTAVGSTNPNSQHTKGAAVDFIVPGVELEEIWLYIKYTIPVFSQNILESSWIHIAYLEDDERKETFKL